MKIYKIATNGSLKQVLTAKHQSFLNWVAANREFVFKNAFHYRIDLYMQNLIELYGDTTGWSPSDEDVRDVKKAIQDCRQKASDEAWAACKPSDRPKTQQSSSPQLVPHSNYPGSY